MKKLADSAGIEPTIWELFNCGTMPHVIFNAATILQMILRFLHKFEERKKTPTTEMKNFLSKKFWLPLINIVF